MARAAGNWILSSTRTINPMPTTQLLPKGEAAFSPNASNSRICASFKGNDDFPLIKKRGQKGLVRISTSNIGRWPGEWKCDYVFSLRDLQLEELAEDQHKNTPVSLHLSVYKHAGFGLSVEARIISSFTTKCINCSSPYCNQIDTRFQVWILASTKERGYELPILGWDDPSVIYVKPGHEAALDSLIQDAIRLATSVKETCSESCEKAELKVQPLGQQNAPSIDRRWSRLLELKKELP